MGGNWGQIVRFSRWRRIHRALIPSNTGTTTMTDGVKGIWALIAACSIWGLSPLFYKLVVHVPPTEVLAHRTMWSCVFFACILLLQGRLGRVPTLLRSHFWVLVVAAMMISVNWFLFIYAVQVGRTVEASLGYYIFPLCAVGLGAVVFGERLSWVQWVCVGLAATAVIVLTVGLQVVPVISLILATTFATYGLIKKRLNAGPVESVTAEVVIILPISLGWLLWLHFVGSGAEGFADTKTLLLLVLSGPLTGGPLILFSYASRRVRMATIGLVQYLNPTLQFICAVIVFGELFTLWHMIAFGLIWTALAVYSGQALAQDRAARKAATTSSTVPQS
jgi:chloramphenicol-sensitive protein RarD